MCVGTNGNQQMATNDTFGVKWRSSSTHTEFPSYMSVSVWVLRQAIFASVCVAVTAKLFVQHACRTSINPNHIHFHVHIPIHSNVRRDKLSPTDWQLKPLSSSSRTHVHPPYTHTHTHTHSLSRTHTHTGTGGTHCDGQRALGFCFSAIADPNRLIVLTIATINQSELFAISRTLWLLLLRLSLDIWNSI